MQVSATNSTTVNSTMLDSTNTSAASRVPSQTLTQNDFLKLLITQLSAQDPMNPVDDKAFIAQMAQFSTLQATTSMQQNIAQLNNQQAFLQANAMIGRDVALQDGQGAQITGTVSAIQMASGSPQIVVNGQAYDLSTVLTVTQPSAATTQP
jgi:flagellar basal-body rod modification protein FlgD